MFWGFLLSIHSSFKTGRGSRYDTAKAMNSLFILELRASNAELQAGSAQEKDTDLLFCQLIA